MTDIHNSKSFICLCKVVLCLFFMEFAVSCFKESVNVKVYEDDYVNKDIQQTKFDQRRSSQQSTELSL